MIRAQLPSVGTCHVSADCMDMNAPTDMIYDSCCSVISQGSFRSSGSDINGDPGDRLFGCEACPAGKVAASYNHSYSYGTLSYME